MTMKTVHLKELINELFHDGFSDTRTYRYWVFIFDTADGCFIKRIRREYLDTDSNLNGWEVSHPKVSD